jgi:preprotein translocase subunit SecD
MYKWALACCFVLLSVGALQAQLYFGTPRFSLRAASVEPVDGWQKMQLEHCQSRCDRWVAPTAALHAGDIESAQPEVRADGYRVIKVVYTDAAVNKMRDLTTAQIKKPIALVVDGKLLWAPQVNFTQADKESSITGNTPTGLTQEEVDLIMSILRSGPRR